MKNYSFIIFLILAFPCFGQTNLVDSTLTYDKIITFTKVKPSSRGINNIKNNTCKLYIKHNYKENKFQILFLVPTIWWYYRANNKTEDYFKIITQKNVKTFKNQEAGAQSNMFFYPFSTTLNYQELAELINSRFKKIVFTFMPNKAIEDSIVHTFKDNKKIPEFERHLIKVSKLKINTKVSKPIKDELEALKIWVANFKKKSL